MKRYLLPLFFIPVALAAQTKNQNYTKAVVYKQAVQDTTGVPSQDTGITVTYYDGLGRPRQRLDVNGANIVTHMEYDAMGRQKKEYLPYPGPANTLAFDAGALAGTGSFYAYYNEGTSYPYAEKFFEASPLNRVLKQSAPGDDWAGNPNSDNDHTIKFVYDTNPERDVRRFFAGTDWNNDHELYDTNLIEDADYYAPNELHKAVTKDENWTEGSDNNHTVEEFTNKLGQVVLKRTYESGDAHDTYYVYDAYGNLTYVIPPLVDMEKPVAEMLDKLGYQYKYDARNRLVAKKLPGKLWEYIVYDKLGRVRFTGPAQNPFYAEDPNGSTGWLFTKYDAFNRVVYTGWYYGEEVNPIVRKELQYYLHQPAAIQNEVPTQEPTDLINEPNDVFYTTATSPGRFFYLLTVNYYDDYRFWDVQIPASILEQPVHYNHSVLPKTLATGTWVRTLTLPTLTDHELSYSLYDSKYRPIRTMRIHDEVSYTQVDSKFDFAGKVLQTTTRHRRGSNVPEVIFSEEFTYDGQDRLALHKHILGGNTQILSDNNYDSLGQLTLKRVGGAEGTGALQNVDYKYNIRGWLTDINQVDSGHSDDASDLFDFHINYNQVADHMEHQVDALYNGNISETFWKSASDNITRKYGYTYDALNRLRRAWYQRPDQGTPAGYYDEWMSYDKNGNITALGRNGDLEEGTALAIDELTYTYGESSNKLLKVADATNDPSGFEDDAGGGSDTTDDYTYDDYGNMLSDENKRIAGITYNHLNLPITIPFPSDPDTRIAYLYNALGEKVRKTVYSSGGEPSTEYLGGFQYYNDKLQFFPTAEGYVKVIQENDQYYFNYVYQYKDHLGNIRMNYALDPSDNVLKILNEEHYYPFGLKHKNYNPGKKDLILEGTLKVAPVPVGEENLYKYKFQGQERQDELGLNWDSFKWRNYDYAIGRFMTIDPLTEKYTDWGPYVFSGNRVIDARELEGLEPYILFKSEKQALRNFGQQYNGKSIKQGVEYGANVYTKVAKDGKTYYAYDKPNVGDADGVSYPKLNVDGAKRIGTIHTHGEYLEGYDNNIFSPDDKENAKNRGVDNNVVTPDGNLLKYDVKTGKVIPIATDMPSDPKDPDRKNNVAPNDNPAPVKTEPIKPKEQEHPGSAGQAPSGSSSKGNFRIYP